MMHHPISNIANGDAIAKSLDEYFQIQIFGHLHKPVSDGNGCIHIHSGAFQPPKDENDKSEAYFSVYNILELDVNTKDGADNLSVQLLVEQYDTVAQSFIDMNKESKHFNLPIKRHINRWKEEAVQLNLPKDVTERTVKYTFLQLPNPKAIIDRMSHYDNGKSHNRNCIDFLNQMQAENRMTELWEEIKKK
jgi:hypothetical protein